MYWNSHNAYSVQIRLPDKLILLYTIKKCNLYWHRRSKVIINWNAPIRLFIFWQCNFFLFLINPVLYWIVKMPCALFMLTLAWVNNNSTSADNRIAQDQQDFTGDFNLLVVINCCHEYVTILKQQSLKSSFYSGLVSFVFLSCRWFSIYFSPAKREEKIYMILFLQFLDETPRICSHHLVFHGRNSYPNIKSLMDEKLIWLDNMITCEIV